MKLPKIIREAQGKPVNDAFERFGVSVKEIERSELREVKTTKKGIYYLINKIKTNGII